MKKLFVLLLCLTMVFAATVLFTGCGSDDSGEAEPEGGSSIVIGFSNGVTGNAWRSNQVDAAEAYLKQLVDEGVIADYIISNCNDVNSQIAGLTDMINKDVDIIVMNADAGEVLAPTMQTALDQGIIVVGTGLAGIDPSPQNVAVATENYNYFEVESEYMAYMADYKGDVIHFYGLEGGWAGGEDRKQAVRDVIDKYPDMNITAGAACSWIEAEGNSAMASLLATYGDKLADSIIIGEDVSTGVLQAYNAAGVTPKYIAGEYTYGWLRTMQENPDIISCVGTYPADTAVSWIDVALLLKEGHELNDDIVNGGYSITLPMPVFIVPEAPAGDEPWLAAVDENTTIMTVEEALAGNEGKSDNDTILGHLDKDTIQAMYFKN